MTGPADRYVVISADCHAGASLLEYKPYLSSRWHDEFDAWAATFANPYGDQFERPDGPRVSRRGVEVNWDSDARLADLEEDGIVAEVLFPNTVPPFYPMTGFFVPPEVESAADYQRRWAGLQAHNRWLADFCAAAPGRRAGIAQLMLNDVDDACREVRWVHERGLTGGVLIPGASPSSLLPGLWSDAYDPLWSLCAELGVPANHHAGAGVPKFAMDPVSQTVQLTELTWYGRRALGHLVFGGVFERHPRLSFVFTELGTGWVVQTLRTLDQTFRRMRRAGAAEAFFGGACARELPRRPSEYFAQNCAVGASFLTRAECDARDAVGVERIMWGADYPHLEGTYPFSREAIQVAFDGVDDTSIAAMLGGNAARVYGFDLTALAPIAGRVGPLVHPEPLHVRPESECVVFDAEADVAR